MTDLTADERIEVIALTVHALVYPRRHRQTARSFAKLVATFVDPTIRARLASRFEPEATVHVIATVRHCAGAVRRL